MIKIKTIREKCIEANPEIVELKFGCSLTGQGIHHGLIIDRVPKSTTMRVEVGDYKVEEINKQDWLHTMEIIGRPIRLADVIFVFMNTPVIGTQAHDIQDIYEICTEWNVRDDNLENQDEETIEFIYELLK